MVKFEKKMPIEEYKEGDDVEDIFVVKIKRKIGEYKNGYFFSLILTDASGKSLELRYWGPDNKDEVNSLFESIKKDDVIFVKGKVSSYKGKLQLTVNDKESIKKVPKDQYNPSEFIKKGAKDIEKLQKRIDKYIEEIKQPEMKKLINKIFNERIKEKFKRHPAAISIHHNWVGGLLEHTLEVVKYCELSSKLFPSLDKDLLLTGALLHDIGKLEEMEMTTRIKGTNKGMFTGHLVLGSILVSKKMDEIDMKTKTKDKILHMMVSHHGKNEHGSPKTPMFPEAVVLHYADDMSTKIAEMIGIVKDFKDETKDDFFYYRKKGKNIFLR